MDQNIYDLANLIGEDIKRSLEYRTYIGYKNIVEAKYRVELEKLDGLIEKKDYKLIRQIKDFLEQDKMYLVYLESKLVYKKYLKTILKDIVSVVGENIDIVDNLG